MHYGHSCLVPITDTLRKVLYIFVEIQIDITHFVNTIDFNLPYIKNSPLHILGTIQFNNSLYIAKQMLTEKGFNQVMIPQEKPRSGGEVLGCTSPTLTPHPHNNVVVFLCDGRFHM